MRGPNWRGIAGKAKMPIISASREATADDIAALRVQPKLAHKDRITKIRDKHHRLARHIAYGMTNMEIAEALGMSPRQVANLKTSPALQELVEQYRPLAAAEDFSHLGEKTRLIQQAGIRARRQILERLEMADEGEIEAIPIRDLMGIAADDSDRLGPIKAKANLNADVSFEGQMERIWERTRRAMKTVSSVGAGESVVESQQGAPLALSATDQTLRGAALRLIGPKEGHVINVQPAEPVEDRPERINRRI